MRVLVLVRNKFVWNTESGSNRLRVISFICYSALLLKYWALLMPTFKPWFFITYIYIYIYIYVAEKCTKIENVMISIGNRIESSKFRINFTSVFNIFQIAFIANYMFMTSRAKLFARFLQNQSSHYKFNFPCCCSLLKYI